MPDRPPAEELPPRRVGRRLGAAAGLGARRGAALGLVAVLVLVAGGAFGAGRPRSLAERAALAETVVRGTVSSVGSAAEAGGLVFTHVRVRVAEALKGAAGAEVRLRFLGGRAGGRAVVVPGAPRFLAGEEVYLFLKRGARTGRPLLVGFAEGKFSVGGDRSVVGRAGGAAFRWREAELRAAVLASARGAR